MAKLIYSTICSLDGYIEDASGEFTWARPSDEVHAFINERLRPVGTHLYGRGVYETMAVWETMPLAEAPPVIAEFAEIWRGSDKIVYSRTLATVSTARTELEREFDAEKVAALKQVSTKDITIGGANLAANAFAAGLVDEVELTLSPVSVGGGKPALPLGRTIDLELIEERRFASGAVNLRYAVSR